MWTVNWSTQFRKDLKRYKKGSAARLHKIFAILKRLEESGTVPAVYRPHCLQGDWKDFMECHVENDVLLIWFEEDSRTITAARLGSHHELFGK